MSGLPDSKRADDPPTWLIGAEHVKHSDGRRFIGVEDHTDFPVGNWTRIYVPTHQLDRVTAALDPLLEPTPDPLPPPAPMHCSKCGEVVSFVDISDPIDPSPIRDLCAAGTGDDTCAVGYHRNDSGRSTLDVGDGPR